MFDNFSSSLRGQPTLADADDVASVPLDTEFEILVGVETCALTLNWAMASLLDQVSDLAGHLLNLDDDELGRLQRRESDQRC